METTALSSLAFAGITLILITTHFRAYNLKVSLEQDSQENFTDATMKKSMRVPVVLKIGSSHIRVTSVSLSEGSLSQKSD